MEQYYLWYKTITKKDEDGKLLFDHYEMSGLEDIINDILKNDVDDFSVEYRNEDILGEPVGRLLNGAVNLMLHDMKDTNSSLYNDVFLPFKEKNYSDEMTIEDAQVKYCCMLIRLFRNTTKILFDMNDYVKCDLQNNTTFWRFSFFVLKSTLAAELGEKTAVRIENGSTGRFKFTDFGAKIITENALIFYYRLLANETFAAEKPENRDFLKFILY